MDLLYKWKRDHENTQAVAIGADPSVLAARERILRMFATESPSAIQLAVDKPEFWEFLLTIELIRDKLGPLRRRLHEIEEGLTYRPILVLDLAEAPKWLSTQFANLLSLVAVLGAIVTQKIPLAWGPPGIPGDTEAILRATTLLRDACEGILTWEEDVAKTQFPDEIDDFRQRMRGWTHGLFAEMEKIPEIMSGPINQRLPGTHAIDLVFKAPDGMEAFGQEFVRRYRELQD
ncbi:hypothetical protein [Polyangium mundeleinium]|uniref:Uncharacterized protein n=1 Tax=Polyangium mundeleinium TaxID=2995306 RepID=A0ABT5EN47_9BACT|nr:hypothetical protein [Polyangium mundeleinium]MDC0743255.1 hypothetical protein [Polyangium mundeleinium]